MKNLIVFLIPIFLFSCNKEEPELIIEDTPPTVGRFRVNLSYLDPNGGTITHDRDSPFRIYYDLFDEGELRSYSTFILINNDEGKKYMMTREIDLRATEITFGITFSEGFRKLGLENGEIYIPVAGDELHFYAFVQDDTGNTTSINIVITLTE